MGSCQCCVSISFSYECINAKEKNMSNSDLFESMDLAHITSLYLYVFSVTQECIIIKPHVQSKSQFVSSYIYIL